MLGPEIDINEEQGVAITRGLLTVARCDGTFDDREKALIHGLVQTPTEGLTDIGPEEIGRSLKGDAARVFLRSCLLVALADREYSDAERGVIEGYAKALAVPAEELGDMAQAVKEYLLSPLARLSNSHQVAEVSKKLVM